MKIAMTWADFSGLELKFVTDVIKSGWISRKTYMPRFEREIAKIHGQEFGMMTNSGTDALRIGLATLKEVHKWKDGSEVIVPAVTFVATVNAVIQNGLKPVFVDVDRATYNLDPGLIASRIGPDTRAIIPVHLFGLPADMSAVMAIANKHNLKVLEDSCETMFVHRVQGDMAAFSTYMSHLIQTGVGGILTTDEMRYDKMARSYMNHGRSANPNRFEFERVGFSSRVTEMEAALGCAQLKRRRQIVYDRQMVAARLNNGLSAIEDKVQLPGEPLKSSWMLYPLVLRKGNRDHFMEYMFKKKIETRQMMPLLNQPVYRDMAKEDDYPVAKWINKNGVCLPCHQLITEKQINYMVKCITEFFR